jgi:hypothetical protein
MRTRKWDAQSLSEVAYLLVACFGLAWGLYKDDAAWIIVGFAVMSYRLIQLSVSSGRYNPVLASIIKKYEQACTEAEVPAKPKAPHDPSDDQ